MTIGKGKRPSGQKRDFMEVARGVVEQAIGEQMDGSPLPQPESDTRKACHVKRRVSLDSVAAAGGSVFPNLIVGNWRLMAGVPTEQNLLIATRPKYNHLSARKARTNGKK